MMWILTLTVCVTMNDGGVHRCQNIQTSYATEEACLNASGDANDENFVLPRSWAHDEIELGDLYSAEIALCGRAEP